MVADEQFLKGPTCKALASEGKRIWRNLLSGRRNAPITHHRARRVNRHSQVLQKQEALPHSLPHGFFDFRNPIRTLEDFARLGTVGGADDAVAFHEVDEVGGAAVADSEAAL